MCRCKLHAYSEVFNYVWAPIASSKKVALRLLRSKRKNVYVFQMLALVDHKNQFKTSTLPSSYYAQALSHFFLEKGNGSL